MPGETAQESCCPSWWMGILGCLALCTTGCPDPNIYGTPRTTPQGEFAHTAGLALMGYRYFTRDDATAAQTRPDPFIPPKEHSLLLAPSYMLRRGILDRLDWGLRTVALSSAEVIWKSDSDPESARRE
jgi:hypothetical protein